MSESCWFYNVLSHDWVMDECLQSYMLKNVSLESIWVKDVDLYNYVGYVYMSESCVIAWLSNGWMPVIINACGQIFACIKQTIYFMLLVSYSLG